MTTGFLIYKLIYYVLESFYYAMFIYFIMSWIPSLIQSEVGRFLGSIVGPYLSIFRRFIPPIGMLDISALVAIFVYQFIEQEILSIVQTFL